MDMDNTVVIVDGKDYKGVKWQWKNIINFLKKFKTKYK